jgi:hypothetical protein
MERPTLFFLTAGTTATVQEDTLPVVVATRSCRATARRRHFALRHCARVLGLRAPLLDHSTAARSLFGEGTSGGAATLGRHGWAAAAAASPMWRSGEKGGGA